MATDPVRRIAVNDLDRMDRLNDLADELIVVSTLLSIMTTSSERAPLMRAMCAAAIERCQGQVAMLEKSARSPKT
jgi:hypothetical protein